MREGLLVEERRAQEYQELEGCTFQPQINERPAAGCGEQSAGPVVVRGLGRYLELKELARRSSGGGVGSAGGAAPSCST